MCIRVWACSVMALTSTGWQWPRVHTAQPPTRSRYSFPASSHTLTPFPRTRGMMYFSASSGQFISPFYPGPPGPPLQGVEEGMGLPAIYNKAGAEGTEAGLHLEQHPPVDDPRRDQALGTLGGQEGHCLS